MLYSFKAFNSCGSVRILYAGRVLEFCHIVGCFFDFEFTWAKSYFNHA